MGGLPTRKDSAILVPTSNMLESLKNYMAKIRDVKDSGAPSLVMREIPWFINHLPISGPVKFSGSTLVRGPAKSPTSLPYQAVTM